MSPPIPAPVLAAPEPSVSRAPRFAPPIRPGAVLLPPALLYASAVVVTAAAQRLAGRTAVEVPWARIAALCAVLLAAAASVRFVARTRGGLAAGLAAATLCACALLARDALSAVPALHAAALATAVVAAAASPSLGRSLRRRLSRPPRPERVTVLAPSDDAAFEAVRRLQAVPALEVASLLVPGSPFRTVSHLVWPPQAVPLRGVPRVERRVVVSAPVRTPEVARTIADLVAHGHAITSESRMVRAAQGRVDASLADPLALLMGRPFSRAQAAASRAFDVVLSATLLLLLSPVLLAVAVAILLETGRPVLYRQRRVGARGKRFDVLKFRSMHRDAEARTGPVWATRDDPRITRVGRFLRRYHLDELPQLWNVLAGSMSLVGPRPERPHFVEVLRRDMPLFDLRTVVRPGLTGWAQIRLAHGASPDDARSKLEHDLYYVANRSPWFDLAILVETFAVVLARAR
jgi:exopolysaccharide biosynthesis polyprenyl glycosylphosphotransferase